MGADTGPGALIATMLVLFGNVSSKLQYPSAAHATTAPSSDGVVPVSEALSGTLARA